MGDYATLKAGITANIKQNDSQLITGAVLQGQLLAMVNELGAGYQFMGVATPGTDPGTPDEKVFYIASEAGTYTNFGGIIVAEGEVAILKYDGTWDKEVTGAATIEQLGQLAQEVYDELHTKNYDNIPLENNISGYIASNGDIIASGSFKVMYVPCAVGDEYKVRFERYTATSARCWAIYSTDDIAEVGSSNLLAIGPVGEAGVDYEIKVEDSNAKLLLIQNNISTASPYNPTLTKVRYSNKFEDLVTEMIASRDWSISGNVIYDSNEIPQSYNVTWSDGTTGTVVMSNFNFDVFEYTTITATYKTMTIIYTLTFDSNGYITNETYNIE